MNHYSSNYVNENDLDIGSMDLKDYLGCDPDKCSDVYDDTLECKETPSPEVMGALSEHLDISDRLTRKSIMVMNEADQVSVLASLTAKLYDKIITKVDDIDYGDIPNTKGDITKLPSYDKLRECIDLLRSILKEFKQDPAPIDVLSLAMANIMSRKDLFGRAFKYKCELPIIIYNNTVLSIVNGISYMIATCIEFIKAPNKDTFDITLDKVAYAKTKSNMLYNNLKRFNKICDNGNLDKVMEEVIQAHIKGKAHHESTAMNEGIIASGVAALATFVTGHPIVGITLITITSLVLLITVIIPLLRDMVFLWYYARVRVSDYLDIQADLLQMNAFRLQNDDTVSNEDKDRVISKQLKYVDLFRKMANKISITNKKAEVEATREISNDSKKMKIDDISDQLPDSVSALF